MKSKIISAFMVGFLLFGYVFAQKEENGVMIMGEEQNLKGMSVLSVKTEIIGNNLYLQGEGDPSIDTDFVRDFVIKELENAGLKVGEDSDRFLTLVFYTPEATFMTYVNLVITDGDLVINKETGERREPLWLAQGYERFQVYPQPITRIANIFIKHWASVNGKKVDIAEEKEPSIINIDLLSDKKFIMNNMIYAQDDIIAVIKSIPGAEREKIILKSTFDTRAVAGDLYKRCIDNGLPVSLKYDLSGNSKEEDEFKEKWNKLSE
jgi:hypothetical protein